MTTETLTTSEAAARVGLSNQYMRVLLGKGKGPKGTREGKGGRGGGYKFLAEDIDAWDAARVKRAPKGSKKGYTYAELEAIAFGTDNAALPLPSNPELAAVTDLIKSMDAGMGTPAEALLGAALEAADDEDSDWDKDCSQGKFGPE